MNRARISITLLITDELKITLISVCKVKLDIV